jgi:large subunit ribosomal protein L32
LYGIQGKIEKSKIFPVYLKILKILRINYNDMAVPKNRTSKAKKRTRKSNWKRKANKAAQKSLSLAKSVLQGKPTSFIYSMYVDE